MKQKGKYYMCITFSTCFYNCRSKFNLETYLNWIDNLLSNVTNFYLVVYTDECSKIYFSKYEKNNQIKIIIKPFEKFYNYQYRNLWILNHEKNHELNNKNSAFNAQGNNFLVENLLKCIAIKF